MKRIFNTKRWTQAPAGQVLYLPGDGARRIELDVNTEAATRVDLLVDDVPIFLAVVNGRELLQFSVTEPDVYLIFTSEGEVWYYTGDGDNTAVERVDAVSFTRMMERRPERNPQLELMMFKMRQNEVRREAVLAEQLAALEEARAGVVPAPKPVAVVEPPGDAA